MLLLGGVYMINRDTLIRELLSKYPETENVFSEFGIRCFG